MILHRRLQRPLGLILGLIWLTSLAPGVRAVTKTPEQKLFDLRKQAELFEKKQQWSRACSIYGALLKHHRHHPQIRQSYLHCLRRYYLSRRHQDKSFRKDVLSLRFSESLKFYDFMLTYLVENSLDHHLLTAEQMFRKGLEEFEYALDDPTFVRIHLGQSSLADVQAFRYSLRNEWAGQPVYSVEEAANLVQDIAKAALRKLKLRLTVTVVEFTCGSCYAVDDYTMYLTPRDLRQLCQALKGEFATSVDYHLKGETIGYIAISEFSETTVPEMDDGLVSLSKMGMKALIVDLRGNRGGLVDPAVEIARRFLSSGVIVSIRSQHSKTVVTYQSRNPDALTLPVVILVNGETGSAAEILAGALKENGRARLVGQQTFGKGCIQELFRLASKDGKAYPGGLRITVTRFFSPNGASYSGKGILPHVLVEPANAVMPLTTAADPQLRAALREIRQMMEECPE